MKKILVVVDIQKGFSKYARSVKLAEDILNLLKRELFDVVVTTRFLNDDNSIYEKLFKWKLMKTAEEVALVDGYEEYSDCTLDKSIYTSVNPSFIQKLCQLNDGKYPEEVFIVGADTDCCVLATATGLFESNIRPIVLTKYCGSNGGDESHNAGLLCLRRLIGSRQLVARDIVCKEDLDAIVKGDKDS